MIQNQQALLKLLGNNFGLVFLLVLQYFTSLSDVQV